MSDIAARLRTSSVVATYDASYPPEVYGGVRLASIVPSTVDTNDPQPILIEATGAGFEDGCSLAIVIGGTPYPFSTGSTFDTSEHVTFELTGSLGDAMVYPVAIQNPGGALSNRKSLRITAPPRPAITGTTPTTITTEAGQAFTINGTGLAAVNQVEVSGVPAQSFTVVDATAIDVVADVGALGDGEIVRVTDSYGASASSTIERVAPTPIVTGTTTGDVCAHGTVEDVKAHVAQHPEEVRAALDAERGGRNRSTLISWLEDFEVDLYPAVDDDDEA
jgi:hypothetical protein